VDGNFPTVASPNPENPEGFYLAIDLAKREGSSLIIGTDPDSDRIGVLVRRGDNFVPVTGNQLGVLLLDYVISAKKRLGTLPENAAAVKSIVTTEMAQEVCKRNGVFMADTFTGFKFMAEKVAEWESAGTYQYIFAYEESYGYMMGDYVRDKDAVTAAMMVAEMAAYYCSQGKTLLDAMDDLYETYGFFAEKTLNLVMPGLDGLKRMREIMATLREQPPAAIADVPVGKVRDYKTGELYVAGLGVVGETHISGSDVLYYELADSSSFIIRPSGTEPKIKIYLLVKDEGKAACAEKIDKFVAYAETLKEI